MKFKLKVDGIKYSANEQRVFGLLCRKKMLSSEIAIAIYSGFTSEERKPFNYRQVTIGVLSSLRRKIAANKEPFRLMRSKRNGPHPMEFWLEKK